MKSLETKYQNPNIIRVEVTHFMVYQPNTVQFELLEKVEEVDIQMTKTYAIMTTGEVNVKIYKGTGRYDFIADGKALTVCNLKSCIYALWKKTVTMLPRPKYMIEDYSTYMGLLFIGFLGFLDDDSVDVLSRFTTMKQRLMPYLYGASLNEHHINRIFSKHARKCEKYYVLDTIKEGRCGANYPSKDITYELTYDVDALPYFGFWVTEGGFKHTYNCALEPSGGFYDSMPTARENNKFTQILPNGTFEVVMKMCIS